MSTTALALESSETPASSTTSPSKDKIKVEFDGIGSKLYFAFGRNVKLAKIKKLFIKSIDYTGPPDSLKFLLDGTTLLSNKTPAFYHMEDGDKITVQTGVDGGFLNY